MKKTELQKIIREEILKELGYGDSSGDFGPTYSPIQVKKELGKMIMDTFKESASVYGPQGQDLSRLGMDLANQLIPKLTKYFEQKFK